VMYMGWGVVIEGFEYYARVNKYSKEDGAK
jgi:hypothetical protein